MKKIKAMNVMEPQYATQIWKLKKKKLKKKKKLDKIYSSLQKLVCLSLMTLLNA